MRWLERTNSAYGAKPNKEDVFDWSRRHSGEPNAYLVVADLYVKEVKNKKHMANECHVDDC